MDTTVPPQEPEAPETTHDPINRLADMLVNLQNRPQSMTIRPALSNLMTFDSESEKFELPENLFHTMIISTRRCVKGLRRLSGT